MLNLESSPVFDAFKEHILERENSRKEFFEEIFGLPKDYYHVEAFKTNKPSTEITTTKSKDKIMKTDWQTMVNEFREAYDLPVADGPRSLSTDEQQLHIQMIRDEFEGELVPAIMSGDLVEMYDAGIDVIYYVIGMLSNAGMQIQPGFEEVHASNMSKLDPETGKAVKYGPNDPSGEPEGKVKKGPNYFQPNLGIILNGQSLFGYEEKAVYKDVDIPVKLGDGPTIGQATLDMDHNGNFTVEGWLSTPESTLPIIEYLGLRIDALSFPKNSHSPEPQLFDDDTFPPYDR